MRTLSRVRAANQLGRSWFGAMALSALALLSVGPRARAGPITFALSFTSITSTPGGLKRDPVNDLYASFVASGTGTFDTNFSPAIVPELSSLLLAVMGAGSELSLWWWRRIAPGGSRATSCQAG